MIRPRRYHIGFSIERPTGPWNLMARTPWDILWDAPWDRRFPMESLIGPVASHGKFNGIPWDPMGCT